MYWLQPGPLSASTKPTIKTGQCPIRAVQESNPGDIRSGKSTDGGKKQLHTAIAGALVVPDARHVIAKYHVDHIVPLYGGIDAIVLGSICPTTCRQAVFR